MWVLRIDGQAVTSFPPDAAAMAGDASGDEPAHHKMANSPNTPISMSKTATVMAIGRMAL